jgi:cellulose synthase/poly-beta-1,6-N-acetylglucosamine synthase-like glycosyltransferase
MTDWPHVTLVIRSYQRIPAMLELAEVCLEQDYDRFDVLVIEQSPEQRRQYREELNVISRSPKLRILEYEPLGPARARNEAIKQATGDILLFMDDDDLPLRTDSIRAHAKNFVDPDCVAVTGREVHSREEDPTAYNTERNRRLCLRYTFLKIPRARTRHTTRVTGVTCLQGTNTSIRRSALLRAAPAAWLKAWVRPRAGE